VKQAIPVMPDKPTVPPRPAVSAAAAAVVPVLPGVVNPSSTIQCSHCKATVFKQKLCGECGAVLSGTILVFVINLYCEFDCLFSAAFAAHVST